MYLHHELREVAADRQSEALARISRLHHLMRESPGFIRSLACRYLGSLTQYAWLRTWVSSADHQAFRKTKPAADFGATRPDGLYWPLASGIATDGHWKSILESGQPDSRGHFLLRVAFSVPKPSAVDFLSARALHDEQVLAFAGDVSLTTYESESEAVESETRTYLSLIRMDDLAAYRLFLESGHSEARIGPEIASVLVHECYEIVEELAQTRL